MICWHHWLFLHLQINDTHLHKPVKDYLKQNCQVLARGTSIHSHDVSPPRLVQFGHNASGMKTYITVLFIFDVRHCQKWYMEHLFRYEALRNSPDPDTAITQDELEKRLSALLSKKVLRNLTCEWMLQAINTLRDKGTVRKGWQQLYLTEARSHDFAVESAALAETQLRLAIEIKVSSVLTYIPCVMLHCFD